MQFASEKNPLNGTKKLSLSMGEIKVFMNANYKRYEGPGWWIDRIIMDREWPVLLAVMGKDEVNGRDLDLQKYETF